MASADRFTRPYLVHPKLIEQPTWGGQYIVNAKGWGADKNLSSVKIGQSYELFSGSNLSLAESSDDPAFICELTKSDAVGQPTTLDHSVPLADLISDDAGSVLGPNKSAVNLLIKYTQALGNSFQVHLKDSVSHSVFKPKPESWYYFEPGLVTFGVKPGVDWAEYERVCREIESAMMQIGNRVATKSLAYADAQAEINALLKDKNPWRFVNTVPTAKDQLVDLSAGGIHHSWEEGDEAPLGNILYELQAEQLDNISTFRSFDKGKMEQSGEIRTLQIDEYFNAIDRTPEANDPKRHMRSASTIQSTNEYSLGRLMESKYYSLDKLDLHQKQAAYTADITGYRHLFVKSGRVSVTAGRTTITVGTAHSCLIPAGALQYHITSLTPASEVLVSY